MAYVGPKGIPLSTFLSWPESDQDAALAWSAHESKRCRSCGWHPDEGPDRPHSHAEMCPGCAELEGARERAKDQPVPGLHVRLSRQSTAVCGTCNR